MILPTLSVPDPANERYAGEAILHSLLSTRQDLRRGAPSQRGGSVGVHWSTHPNVSTAYFDNLAGTEQSGVPLSKGEMRRIRRSQNDSEREHDLYSDLSGTFPVGARPFSASVIWHGSVVDPASARFTEYKHEHEVDLERGAPVSVHGFSYRIPQSGMRHLGSQFTRVNLANPVIMTVSKTPLGGSWNEMVSASKHWGRR